VGRTGSESLTPERIYDAGLALVDERGADGLSMRRLGAALGVDPMAVYHHVPNKEALFHGIVRRVFAEMPKPDERGSWPTRVREWARNYRAVVESHPNLAMTIVTSPVAVAVAAGEANAALRRALRESGLRPADAERAGGVIVDYVNGSVLPKATGEAVEAGLADALDDLFEFGLDVIVAGLVHLVP
jgi:TetR/AcrR family transcriptional regulator, tetracycline repressor protein